MHRSNLVLQVPNMTVANARTLYRAGITSPDALAECGPEPVAQALAIGLAKVALALAFA